MISPKRIIGGSLSNVTSWVMTDPPRKTSQELGQWEAGVGEGRSARARWIEGTREGRKKERKKETLLSSCIKAEPLNIFSSLIVETSILEGETKTKRFFFVNYKGFGSFRYLFSCFRVFQIFPASSNGDLHCQHALSKGVLCILEMWKRIFGVHIGNTY